MFNPGTNSNVSGSLWNMLSQQTGEDAAMRRQQSGQQFSNMLDLRQYAEKHQEEEKKVMQAGKVAESIFKMNPDIQKAAGLSPEAFAALAAQDKDAIVTGHFKNLGAQELMQRLTAQQEQAANMARESDFMAALGQVAPTGPIDLRAITEAASASGYRPDLRTLDDILRAANQGQAGGAEALDWESVKPHFGQTPQGQPFIYGRSGQYQVLPDLTAGVRYDTTPGGAELVTDSMGRTKFSPDTSRRSVNQVQTAIELGKLAEAARYEVMQLEGQPDPKTGQRPELTPEQKSALDAAKKRLEFYRRQADEHISELDKPRAAGRPVAQYPAAIGPSLPVSARPVVSPPPEAPSAGPAVSLPPTAFAPAAAAAAAPPQAGFNPLGIARSPVRTGLDAIQPQVIRAATNDALRGAAPAPETNGLPVTTTVPGVDWRGEMDRAANQETLNTTAAAAAAKTAGWVRMISPSGRAGFVAPERVIEFEKKGYERAR